MNKQFIEYNGFIIICNDDNHLDCEEKWMIAYNHEKQNVYTLTQMWKNVKNIGCGYSDEHMKEIAQLKNPYCFLQN